MTLNNVSNLFKGDKIIWMVFFFLILVSLVEVFSASSGLTYKSGSYMGPLLKHGGILFGGFLATLIILNISALKLKPFPLIFYILGVFFLLVAIVVGERTNGASRWLNLGFVQFQPSELMKGILVWVTAVILSSAQRENGVHKTAIWWVLIFSSLPIFIILMENFSTAALISLTIFLMMFIARVPSKQLGIISAAAVLMVVLFISYVLIVGKVVPQQPNKNVLTEQTDAKNKGEEDGEKTFHRVDTWKSRILKFFDKKELSPNEVDLDKDAQVAHANIAIASSNIKGLGPGNSVERDFLSQAFSDFIYAIIIEELGLLGAAGVAFLYIILLFRAGVIARKCNDSFLSFLVMGYALLLVVQAVFNMAVAVGLAPVTGQPLPLISKGGTSTIINCGYIGIILGVSRLVNKRENAEKQKLEQHT